MKITINFVSPSPQVLNSSQNLPIYWNVGTGFKNTLTKQVRNVFPCKRRLGPDKGEGLKKETLLFILYIFSFFLSKLNFLLIDRCSTTKTQDTQHMHDVNKIPKCFLN